jgi:hypothetical protein
MHEIQLDLLDTTPAEYHSYLLRIWRSTAQGDWRILLESVADGERHTCTDLEHLFALLRQQIHMPPSTGVQATSRATE